MHLPNLDNNKKNLYEFLFGTNNITFNDLFLILRFSEVLFYFLVEHCHCSVPFYSPLLSVYDHLTQFTLDNMNCIGLSVWRKTFLIKVGVQKSYHSVKYIYII